MPPNPLLFTLGVALLSLALRSFAHPLLRKLGSLCILATSFFAGYFLTGFWQAGLLCAGTWFLLPLLEILTRVRRLRLPTERMLASRMPPPRQVFPALRELTAELEELGFGQGDDVGWEWEDQRQFFRLFYKEDERLMAAICLLECGEAAFHYLSFASRAADGTVWASWNCPFSRPMKLAPTNRLQQVRDLTPEGVLASHRAFLQSRRVAVPQLIAFDPEEIQQTIERDLEAQIAHNVAAGLLLPASEGHVRYSWRGLLFVWVQSLRDLVRHS